MTSEAEGQMCYLEDQKLTEIPKPRNTKPKTKLSN
jgi:hypothetical protein